MSSKRVVMDKSDDSLEQRLTTIIPTDTHAGKVDLRKIRGHPLGTGLLLCSNLPPEIPVVDYIYVSNPGRTKTPPDLGMTYMMPGRVPDSVKDVFLDPRLCGSLCDICIDFKNLYFNEYGRLREAFCGSCRSGLGRLMPCGADQSGRTCGRPRFVDAIGQPGALCKQCFSSEKCFSSGKHVKTRAAGSRAASSRAAGSHAARSRAASSRAAGSRAAGSRATVPTQ